MIRLGTVAATLPCSLLLATGLAAPAVAEERSARVGLESANPTAAGATRPSPATALIIRCAGLVLPRRTA